MVAHVARGHRGDGGNEPPNGNPNRILHACESSQPKRRSKGKNINLYDKFSENNKQKLPIEVDDEENQYRFVGDNQSVFVRCISNEVARMVPFHFASWESVPHHYKRGLYPVISNYFNLDRFKGTDDWEGIKLGIRAECANAYRNRKRRCKAHFERVGGYEDTARARSHPPEGVSPEAWERLINDLYLDPKYKDRCLRNKANRAKQPFKSSHGSQSYAQKRHLNAKKTGKPGHIEVWKRAHYKEGRGWENAAVEGRWDRIQTELAKMQKEAGDEPVNELECLKRALGRRPGHIRGVGRVVKTVSPDITSSSYVHASEYNELHEQWQEQQRINQEQEQVNQRMQEQLAQLLAMVNKHGSSRQEPDGYDESD